MNEAKHFELLIIAQMNLILVLVFEEITILKVMAMIFVAYIEFVNSYALFTSGKLK